MHGKSITMKMVKLVLLSLDLLISVFVMYLCLITARRFMPDSSSVVIDVSCSLLLICDGILNRNMGLYSALTIVIFHYITGLECFISDSAFNVDVSILTLQRQS